jgi:hypothetical protein
MLTDKIELLDSKGVPFATAWIRSVDESEDIVDQLEFLVRAAKEHIEGTNA